jgi:F-type H+-transporting ATPase subunit b
MSTLRPTRFATALLAMLASGAIALTAYAAPPPAHVSSRDVEVKHEEEGPKPINWFDFGNKEQPPYLAAFVNFAILVGAYAYYGKRPVAAALQGRREQVSKQIEEAQKIKHEAEARSKQYEAKLEALNDELATTRATLVAAGVSEKARIVRDAEEKAARMQKDALFQLDQERKQMHADLQRETVAVALAAAESLLRNKLTQADQERVAEEFLATLVPSKNAPSAGGAS